MTLATPADRPPSTGAEHVRKRWDPVQRRSSATTRWHMSSKAVDRSVEEFSRWSDLRCIRHLANVRWGSYVDVVCAHCNTCADHYWSAKEMRWKCKACGKRFSVTSQTVFANRRIPLQKLLAALHLWACGAAGQPALELRRMLKLGGYNTAFTLVSKLREGLVRGFNTGLISGIVEMDGAHASGRRASEKRGKPLNYRSAEAIAEDEELALLTSAAKSKKRKQDKAEALAAGGVLHPEHGNVFPPTRRVVVTLRRRHTSAGSGSSITRVGVGIAETPEVMEALAKMYVAIPESVLSTDTGTAFNKLGKKFQLHLQVNHSETLVGPDGQHSNNAESFSARQDRSEKGVYMNIEPKYLHDYAVETAFREDYRRFAPGKAADLALHHALNVGESHFWRGFTHGHHRKYEILATGNKPARASGPAKGPREPTRPRQMPW
ncbi:IS1595 family transposase [Hydrogenophaga sp.]|uniref:IS1595 family transposase n=1 Tax=Hydrogenophaga sp. TaxID=1904254 RepID=UPI002FC89365